ncbi:MAG: DUF1919 domain-containing protein [Acutalibacteraceae bacterium]|nr:DUF1919 domain-containing protein [Acutalibacteraceae bacterium]
MKKICNYLYKKIILSFAGFFNKIYQKFYFKKLRRKLKNHDFSLFSPNCYAGIIYHRLGMSFSSPTINMFFPIKKQYLKFVSNIEYYVNQELRFIDDPQYPTPVAYLDDVKLVFNHYKTAEEAETSWNRRKKRINYNNIFIIFDDIADADYNDLIEFNKIKCNGKVILSAHNYENLHNLVQISKYKKTGIMQPYLMDKNIWTGKNPADKDFDFVKWLNSGQL